MMTIDNQNPPKADRSGVVYALVASDEPLQIRYVGQTQQPSPQFRLHAHRYKANQLGRNYRLSVWIREVEARQVKVEWRVLGSYIGSELLNAEQDWIKFWSQYCDVLSGVTAIEAMQYGLAPYQMNQVFDERVLRQAVKEVQNSVRKCKRNPTT